LGFLLLLNSYSYNVSGLAKHLQLLTFSFNTQKSHYLLSLQVVRFEELSVSFKADVMSLGLSKGLPVLILTASKSNVLKVLYLRAALLTYNNYM
jgi:hypothetical protein